MKFYFTFGSGQEHANGYHTIEADSVYEARAIMHKRFGNEWSTVYESAKAAGIEKYQLNEVFWPLPKMFSITIYKNAIEVEELSAEFRTLNAACIYMVDCIKMLIETSAEQVYVLAHIMNSKKEPVWWVEGGNTLIASAIQPLTVALFLNRIKTKLFSLNEEELEHIEFAIDAFIKRRRHIGT